MPNRLKFELLTFCYWLPVLMGSSALGEFFEFGKLGWMATGAVTALLLKAIDDDLRPMIMERLSR